jgi:hypothetical protein
MRFGDNTRARADRGSRDSAPTNARAVARVGAFEDGRGRALVGPGWISWNLQDEPAPFARLTIAGRSFLLRWWKGRSATPIRLSPMSTTWRDLWETEGAKHEKEL